MNRFVRILAKSLLRAFGIVGGLALVVTLGMAYARWVEPTWLSVQHITLSAPSVARVIHISDIHFTGDTQYLERVVRTINRMDADCVCFTGDLVEEVAFLKGALHVLSKINKPLYGVPGNHDRWAFCPVNVLGESFRKTGGDWLNDKPVLVPSKPVALLTLASLLQQTPPGYKRILLEHHPDAVERIEGQRFDLILAGHTHGGQVRIPFLRRWTLPIPLDKYDKGLFQTPGGPLYVNPGIGTFYRKLRFRCRPEITLIEI
jgi:predicted MPP superfamily phosphohydrolase